MLLLKKALNMFRGEMYVHLYIFYCSNIVLLYIHIYGHTHFLLIIKELFLVSVEAGNLSC